MKIEALEVSNHISNFDSTLTCVSVYNNALNFLSPSQQLITLHRQGKGLSPMGWLLADTDFNLVAQYVQPNTSIMAKAGKLVISPALHLVAKHYTDLSVPNSASINLEKLEQLLPILSVDIATGLYGALRDYQRIVEYNEIRELVIVFSEWLCGEPIDWQSHLGRGPGLTPSSDDMLTGMLFAAYLCVREQVQGLAPFFKNTPDLSLLTTTISQHYLDYAAQGIFSSYLVQLAQRMACHEDILHNLFELLSVGHHSGADTLLGIGLGYQAIKRCNYH